MGTLDAPDVVWIQITFSCCFPPSVYMPMHVRYFLVVCVCVPEQKKENFASHSWRRMRLFFLGCSVSSRGGFSYFPHKIEATRSPTFPFSLPFPFRFLSYFLFFFFFFTTLPPSSPLVHTPSSFSSSLSLSLSLSLLFLTPHRHPLTAERKGIQTIKKRPSLVQTQPSLIHFHTHHHTRYACLSFLAYSLLP